jgi:pyruvate,water dikinase
MHWRPLKQFHDSSVPKLYHLRQAARAGVRVPPTVWLPGREAAAANSLSLPSELGSGSLIVRSGSPTEDGQTTSNAGQFLSVVVRVRDEFAAGVAQVAAALPNDADGIRQGTVFVQPLVCGIEAGVAFFDGFYFEQTVAAGGNMELTSGRSRGRVRRGHLMRDDLWSAWLLSIHGAFRHSMERIDIEFARDASGFVLLQIRPALFPIRRNETLSLANVKETMGELPSPWSKAALVDVGRSMPFLGEVGAFVRAWQDPLIIEIGGRLWNNVSPWFRLADHIGVPRTTITETLGGQCRRNADREYHFWRLLLSLPRLSICAMLALRHVFGTRRALRKLDAQIEAAPGIEGLFAASRAGMELLIVRAASIMGLLILVALLRRLLRISGTARLVTQEMMDEYHTLAALPSVSERERGLDAWLASHGHRGPNESDLAQPRFAEMRELLLQDLTAANIPTPLPRRRIGLGVRLLRPFYWLDSRREWFRDTLMRRWQRLRNRILEEGRRLVRQGDLDTPDDIFWLRGTTLPDKATLRDTVAAERAKWKAVCHLKLPVDSTRDELEATLKEAAAPRAMETSPRQFPGIALVPAVLEGIVLRADNLREVLADIRLGPGSILIVPALEPAWAVVFPRVGGVVAEVGGELSHASILLREIRRPAIVNCTGIYSHVRTGDRVRLDGIRGVVELMTAASDEPSPGVATPGLKS